MGLFSYLGKLRVAASKLMCRLPVMTCEGGTCCFGQWHAAGAEGTQSSCDSGQIYLEWGNVDPDLTNATGCCGCLPEQIYDPRVGGLVNTVDVQDDLCCPIVPGGYPLPYDPFTGAYVGCMGRCCRDGVCTDELEVPCVTTGGVWYPGQCAFCSCPAGCCAEDADGTVTCEQIDCAQQNCVAPRVLADPDCETGCLGQCCLDDEEGNPQPQGMMTQEACDAIGGAWQGLGETNCSGCPCRDPFDCACCEKVSSTAAGITFFQPRRKRHPQFTDTFRVTVTGRTESSIYVHGIPVGAACEFEVTFLLCGESFNIEPVECGTNFKKLEVQVCWQEEHTSGETLKIRGCETGTIAAGSCRPDGCNGSGDCTPGSGCTTTLLHDETGAETDADIQVNGRLTIDSSGSGPLVLTGDLTVPATSCSLTIVVTGTNDDLNRIDGDILQQGSNIVIVEKRGSGTWGLGGANTHTGQLRILEGTLVVLADVDGQYGATGSPFGKTPSSSVYPVVGGDASNTITAALLFADGVTIERAFTVPANAAQTVILGGYGGTSSVASTVTNTISRDVTFQAAGGATVTFSCLWLSSVVDPIITVGTAGNAGTVVFDNYLPGPDQGTGYTSAFRVEHGTARLIGADNRIDPTTPVTVGSATLHISGVTQALSYLSFVESGGAVTGGTLRPVAVEVDGSGNAIASAVSLAQAATFTVEEDADLTVSGVVSGAFAINKNGDGLLVLAAENTYSGGTTINGGTAKAGDVAAFGTGAITVNAGGTLDKAGFALANTITNNGGTVLN